MYKIKINTSLVLFFFTSLFSYVLFLAYYDSTTGLDFPLKYSNYISHFTFGSKLIAQDGQSIIYYFLISKIVALNSTLIGPYNLNFILNNSIQAGNFILTLLGYYGIFKFYKYQGIKTPILLYCFSILNFFPPLIYLRLTFKSEILAFTLFPWLLYLFLKVINKNSTNFDKGLFMLIFSILLTIKPSVSAIFLLSFVFYANKKIIEIYKYLTASLIITLIFLYLNYQIVGLGFLEHLSSGKDTLWDNRATLKFFYNFNLKSLISEPIFNLRSNSFLSILFIDTYSDYFTFFWKHNEPTNLLAQNTIYFSNNFFIKKYLRDYIAIGISIVTYFTLIYFYLKNKMDRNRKLLLFGFFGIVILIINSIGVPSNNFNPLTGDTFKVHYFAFVLTISVTHLLIIIGEKRIKVLCLFIPVFIFIMGFPKHSFNENKDILFRKIESSSTCYVLQNSKRCRNEFINTCKAVNTKLLFSNRTNLINNNYFIEPIKLVLGENIVYARNESECYQYFKKGYRY